MVKVLGEGVPLYYKSNEDKTRWKLRTYLNLLKSIDLDSTYLARTLKKITERKRMKLKDKGRPPKSPGFKNSLSVTS